MPIKIPNDLPARQVLVKENISVISEGVALRQDIRPMEIAILNLMPTKEKTETQLLRVLGNSPLQVNVTLLKTARESNNACAQHMQSFYNTFDEIKQRKFDGLIVTGAPVETLDFTAVTYWQELCAIFDWAKSHVYESLYICWGAQAALYHRHRIGKKMLSQKLFGVYDFAVQANHGGFLNGFSDRYGMPVSRHTGIDEQAVYAHADLHVLADSDQAGIALVREPAARALYMFNHLEYDADTLRLEYVRDVESGKAAALPYNYFPNNDPHNRPINSWRSHGFLFFSNWLDQLYRHVPHAFVSSVPSDHATVTWRRQRCGVESR